MSTTTNSIAASRISDRAKSLLATWGTALVVCLLLAGCGERDLAVSEPMATVATSPTNAAPAEEGIPASRRTAPTAADCLLTPVEVQALNPDDSSGRVNELEVGGMAGEVAGGEFWVSDPRCTYMASTESDSEAILKVNQYTYGSQSAGEVRIDELGTRILEDGVCADGFERQRTYDIDSAEQAEELLARLVRCEQGVVIQGSDDPFPGRIYSRGNDAHSNDEIGKGLFCFEQDNCFLVTDEMLINFSWLLQPKGMHGPEYVTYALDEETARYLLSKL